MFPVSIRTLGCKLNQVESEALAGSFKDAGFALAPSHGKIAGEGIVIVNTCTVTSKADQKARALIRRALRENPRACVIVTGCYAKLDPAEIEALWGGSASEGARRLFVPPGGEEGAGAAKSALLKLGASVREAVLLGESLPDAIESWMACQEGRSEGARDPFAFRPGEFAFHSRGYLKIQDGCDSRCAYCRARLARGPSASLPPDAALARLRALEENGCAEVALAGVNITQYRHSGFDLPRLLESLIEGTRTIALRLSSLEPEGIDERLVSALAHPRIRPHFHITAQSGSDRVLRVMGRRYDARAVEKAAALLRSTKENPFLACDIIAGFPSEAESDFALTLELCEKIRFAWIHAFPYSPRPGTLAFSFGDRVSEREARRRVGVLTDLATRGRREYAAAWLDRELSAVVEKREPQQGRCQAVSENYLRLAVNCAGGAPPPGSAIRCVPVTLCPDGNDSADAIADALP